MAKTPPLSPREFLRSRRPERFSDSVSEDTPSLDRLQLEYHLDSLTSRSQEREFERFARMLAALEICPNLLPQTGPTGGGDSKVDTETYPVTEKLSAAWYVGNGDSAGSRWAFAFSAKKVWRSKVQSDIKKIAETKRGYTKAFFITNQFVPDKKRAKLEDDLRLRHGLDVRILDRTWILDRVFIGKHELLAIKELGISVSQPATLRKGPQDIRNEQRLQEVEGEITTAVQGGQLGIGFVDDCIYAARLSRGLERPRTETDGRFARAERAAAQHGTTHQRLLVAYEQAWTAFWWHEDYKELVKLYSVVEERAKGTRSAYDLELVTNLWLLLRSGIAAGHVSPTEAHFSKRTRRLTAELEHLSKEVDRPSTALQARKHLLLMQLNTVKGEEVDAVLNDLREVVVQSDGFVGFPVESLLEVLTELGEVVGERPAYESLCDLIVETKTKRSGDVAGARLLVKRGAQQIEAGKSYDAIRSIGRALVRLYKNESQHDLVHALYLCSSAYSKSGLLWAARGAVLNAASVAANEFWTYSSVTKEQAICYKRMKWLELQLGRLPQALVWHELDLVVRSVLRKGQAVEEEQPADEDISFDAYMSQLFLRADLEKLKDLHQIPDVLDRLGLWHSSMSLRFALGYEDAAIAEFPPAERNREIALDLFRKCRDYPVDGVLLPLQIQETRKVLFQSNILGCRVSAECDNNSFCVQLAESLLAALESLLATGLLLRVVAKEPNAALRLRASDFADTTFTFELSDENGLPNFELVCGDLDPQKLSQAQQEEMQEKLRELTSAIFARCFLIPDPESTLKEMLCDERAFERAVGFTGSFSTLRNVLGDSPKTDVAALTPPGTTSFPLLRKEAWDAEERRASQRASSAKQPFQAGEGQARPELDNFEKARHSDMVALSPIRGVLWDQAKWSGTGFMSVGSHTAPPIMLLLFEDAVAAKKIFLGWRTEFGKEDKNDNLQVTIVRGIDRANPHAYRVVIGGNMASMKESQTHFIAISRLNRMDAKTDENLNRFLESQKACGGFFLSYGVFDGRQMQPVLAEDVMLAKRTVHVKEAWQVGRNDPASMGVQYDDDPIVPDGVGAPPVLELLEWKRAHER